MFRRDFMTSLLSILPASWSIRRGSDLGVGVPDIRKAIEDSKRTILANTQGPPVSSVMGLVTEHHCSRITHTFNPDFSTRVTMEGWFRVAGGPPVLNAVDLKVRRASHSGQPCDSPIPRPLTGTRRLSLDLRVSPDSKTVHWYAVDYEDLSGSQASIPNP